MIYTILHRQYNRFATYKMLCRCYMKKSGESSIGYCLSLIKKRDYENYLCTLLIPSSSRVVGVTSRALNIELSTIQDYTTELHTAKLRIDFWRKNIEQTFMGVPPSHPVFLMLSLCLKQQHYLSQKWFTRLVDIRERYLNSKQFMSLSDAEEYGDYAVSSIFYLLLESTANNDDDLIHAAGHLGKAIYLVTLIRSVPYFLQKQKVILPIELCVKHSISQEDIIRKMNEEKIREVIYDIASQAFQHLEHMKSLISSKKNLSNIFLPSVPCELFLSHIQKLDFNVYHNALNQKNWILPFKLLLNSWSRKM